MYKFCVFQWRAAGAANQFMATVTRQGKYHPGFGIDQVRKILQSVRGKRVIGGDVVCLMPTVDTPNQITSYRAMAVMFEMISLIADQHQ